MKQTKKQESKASATTNPITISPKDIKNKKYRNGVLFSFEIGGRTYVKRDQTMDDLFED